MQWKESSDELRWCVGVISSQDDKVETDLEAFPLIKVCVSVFPDDECGKWREIAFSSSPVTIGIGLR